MSGQCFQCAATFGLFKKEVGCKNCGFIFCKDCLKKKIQIPKLNNEKHRVCGKCFNILSGATSAPSPAKYSPPAAYKKRMAALENPSSSKPIDTAIPTHKDPKAKYRGMSKEDIAIARRLEDLKESRQKDQPPVPSQKEMEARLANLKKKDGPPPPTEREMAERLAKLKGLDPNTANTPQVFKPDKRGQQQQIDDLLEEICDEVSIDNGGLLPDVGNQEQKYGPQGLATAFRLQPANQKGFLDGQTKDDDAKDEAEVADLIKQVACEMELDAKRAIEGLKKDKEIWERLQNIQDKKGDKAATTEEELKNEEDTQSDSEDEEESAKRLIKQLILESKLDEKCELSGSTSGGSLAQPSSQSTMSDVSESTKEDPEELPWCCICNEDAVLRCLGCDGDLYCQKCYKQGHDRFDYGDHKTKPYSAPSK